MPEHSIPDAGSTWATDPLDVDHVLPAASWDDPLDDGNGTGPVQFPVETPEPVREVAAAQPATWPTSAFDIMAAVDAVDPEPAQTDSADSAVAPGATGPAPAFSAALRIDDAGTGTARVDMTATGTAAFVNALVESAMMAFMEESKQ